MNELVFHRRAARYFQRLPADKKAQLKAKLEKLRERPESFPGFVRMVGDWAGYCRIRHGDLRIIYCYKPEENRIYLNYIGPRGDVYKG